MENKKTIGVLALQGAVEPHRPHIEACGAEFRAVKKATELAEIDALIIPGGESTTMLKLIERFGLWDALADFFKTKATWGICAGSILLAEKVYRRTSSPPRAQASLRSGDPGKESSKAAHVMDPVRANSTDAECQRDDDWVIQKSFGALPITIERNGYGRQIDSHIIEIEGYPVSFIRAPIIKDAGNTDILASHQDAPVWLKKDHIMVSTFHPELTLNFPSPMHRKFIAN